jgi:TRAP-type uncharacterized transport system substrate-binding protein
VRTFLLTLLLSVLWLSPSQAVELRLMTGSEQGTYYQIGQEISKATDRTGVHLQILTSQGSWENIVALFNSDTEFAIFQVDAFMKAAKNLYRNTSVKIDEEIRVVMPLYREEIHVIKSLGRELDFAGQKSFVVTCGSEYSGSCLTAAVIEEAYDKKFEFVYDDYETAFANLKAGTIDLVIITAGKPYPLLVEQSGLDLVSLPRFDKVTEFDSRASLGPEDYPWLMEDVDTYAVRSVLATMIHEEEGLANDLVGSVHFALRVNENELKKNGHPKWNDVLFNGYIKGLGHAGALRSLKACNVIKGFGYSCTDIDPDK